MTTPERSFAGRFTRRGRLRNRWAEALTEQDPIRRLRSLLDLQQEFVDHAKALAPLWPSYVAGVLEVGGATSENLSELEKHGAAVAERSGGRLALADAWSALIAARDARGEHDIANLRITELYWSADLPAPAKASAARQLARRHADTPNFWPVYVEHLAGSDPSSEPEMAVILAAGLTVGFEVPLDRISTAGELADSLRNRGVAVPGIDLARGFAALCFIDDPNAAVAPLESAWLYDKSETALVALVSAWLRAGAHARLAALLSELTAPRVVSELAELSAMLHWLDDADVPGSCPSTVSRLSALNVRVEAGDRLDYAIGRAHLLEGDAAEAARILVPLADRHPGRPDWNYHAAWALLLLGDRDGVKRRFDATEPSQRWTIGLLLMEADPGSAEAIRLMIPTNGIDATAISLIADRAELIRTGTASPERSSTIRGSGAAKLENLRGGVAAGIAAEDARSTGKWLRDPSFLRLPLADRLLWQGLCSSQTSLIERAADELGYARAALVLSVLTRDPSRLDRLRHRTDPTIELLRAWADPGTAQSRLATLGDRAHYARGQLLLADKDFAAATEEFRTASAQRDAVPRDVATLHWVTSVAAGAEPVERPGARLDRSGGSPWLTWAVALLSADDPDPDPDADAAKHLVSVLTKAEAPPAAAIRAAAAVIAKAALRSTEPSLTALTVLTAELAAATGDPEALRMRELVSAGAARAADAGLDADTDITGAPTALVAAERALASGDNARALRALRSAPEDDTAASRICHQAVEALTGSPSQPPEPWSPAQRLLVAAGQADEAPALAVQTLMPLLRERDLTGIVNLHNALPHLQAGVSSRRVPDYLSRLVRQVTGELDDPRATARHLAGIGDHEAAEPFWRKAIDVPDPAARAEYAAVLCHRAVLARRRGDDLRAADHLLLAARVRQTSTSPFAVIDKAEITTLNKRVERVPQGVARARTAIQHALGVARDRGDETRVLLCLERLDAYIRNGTPAESPLVTWAERLILGWCVDRLIGKLFPADDAHDAAGRFGMFEHAVDTDGTLLFALLDQDWGRALEAWGKSLAKQSTSVPLRHSLAVLYRERALAGSDAVSSLATATLLWARLLSTPKFWAGQREEVRADQQRLRSEVMRELLSEHAVRGQRELTAGAADVATPHLRCIIDCADVAAVDKALDRLGLKIALPADPERFADVAAVAREALDGWVSDLIDAAQEVVDDPAAVAKSGLDGDYESGIKVLRPFLELRVPVRRLLQTALRWYNEWCMALYSADDLKRLAEVCRAASEVAEQLEPLCDRKKVLDPGNQTLSRHLMLRGFTERDAAKAIKVFNQALVWDPGNSNAASLLEDAKLGLVHQRFEEAMSAINAGKLEAALNVLKGIETGGSEEEMRRDLMAKVHFMRAARAVEQRNLTSARDDLRRAADLAADPVSREVIEGKLAVVKLEIALRDKKWAAAKELVREGVPNKDDSLEMAAALNARAVELENEFQQVLAKFETALLDVLKQVQSEIYGRYEPYFPGQDVYMDLYSSSGLRAGPGTTCAVCKGPTSVGRQALVRLLANRIRGQREYRVRVVDFWDEHRTLMCDSCRREWPDRADLRVSQDLLREAARLAPRNLVIRRNLKRVKEAE